MNLKTTLILNFSGGEQGFMYELKLIMTSNTKGVSDLLVPIIWTSKQGCDFRHFF